MRSGIARHPLYLGSLVLALALFLAAIGVGTISAQSSITVKGDVVNGTQGTGPFAAELPVLLLVSASDGSLAATGQTTTDAAGRFRFDQVDRLDGATYTVGVEYAGVLYRTSLTAQDLGGKFLPSQARYSDPSMLTIPTDSNPATWTAGRRFGTSTWYISAPWSRFCWKDTRSPLYGKT